MLFFPHSLGFAYLGHTYITNINSKPGKLYCSGVRVFTLLFSICWSESTWNGRLWSGSCFIRPFSAFMCHLFPGQRSQKTFFHGKATDSIAQESSWHRFCRWDQYQSKPRYYWKEGIGIWKKIWEHLLLFALEVPSMYYIKYKNKRNWKEISTAQDFGGIKSQTKFMIPYPLDVFIPLWFSFLYIILYIRYSFPKIHIYIPLQVK